MNCIDCCYNLPKDGHSYCTYEEGECVKISVLEKENAELDCQKNRNKFCYSCAYATERCFRNEIGCPCGKYKSYKEENAELKEKVKCAEHNCKVKQEFNDNQFNAIMKLKDEFTKSLAYAKSIVKDLLDNSDEYAKQRAREFLEENK